VVDAIAASASITTSAASAVERVGPATSGSDHGLQNARARAADYPPPLTVPVPLGVGVVVWPPPVRAGAVGVVGRAGVGARGTDVTVRTRATGTVRVMATVRTGALTATAAARTTLRRAVVRGLSAGSAGTGASPRTVGCELGAARAATVASRATIWPGARSNVVLAREPLDAPVSAHAPANSAAHKIPVATIAPRPHDTQRIVCT
jgi:hypothetical protein